MRGSIVKRGAGYSIIYRAPDPATGRTKQVWKSGFRTKNAAERVLRTIIDRIDDGTYTKPTIQTFHQFVTDDWLPSLEASQAAGRLRRNTVEFYRHLMTRHVLPTIGALDLHRITPEVLNQLYAKLLASGRHNGLGLSRSTVAKVHVAIGRALRDATRWERVTRNAATLADPPRPEEPDRIVWTAEQLRAFLAHVNDDRQAAMWLLFATTGMRRGEIAGLRWHNLDLDTCALTVTETRIVIHGSIHVSRPKTKKGERVISLDPATVAALRAHRRRQSEEKLKAGPAWQDSGHVFVQQNGAALHPSQMSATFRRHASAGRLPAIKLHGLRHSYASAALEAGEDLKTVSSRLGHSQISTTADIYTKVSRQLDQEAANRVAGYILGAAEAMSC